MQIVVNITKEEYIKLKQGRIAITTMRNALLNGTVLSDNDKLLDNFGVRESSDADSKR